MTSLLEKNWNYLSHIKTLFAFFYRMNKLQKTQGRIILTLRLIFHLNAKNDGITINLLKSCFAKDFKHIKKPLLLDSILKTNIDVLR